MRLLARVLVSANMLQFAPMLLAQTAKTEAPLPPVEAVKPAEPLSTPAQSFIRKLPPNALDTAAPRRFSSGDYANPRTAIVLDEIRVYGQVDPEDYVGRKKTPMAQFRERLERDRPTTPAEKMKTALCFIGLCANYGPDGLPPEVSPEQRTEARMSQTTMQSDRQLRGTLQ